MDGTYNAISEAPVEIWAEILEHLLNESRMFTTDPFYPGCHLHASLQYWYDRNQIRNVEMECRNLRLVSRAWKALIDLRFGRYSEVLTVDEIIQKQSQWRLASRIHIGLSTRSCSCGSPCLCCTYYSDFRDQKNGMEVFGRQIRQFADSEVLPVRVLVLPFWAWAQITEMVSEGIPLQAFSGVKVLSISGPIPIAPALPPVATLINKVCPRLTFLSIHFSRFNDTFHKLDHITFPTLSTLIISVTNQGGFDNIQLWDIPALKHMAITQDDYSSSTPTAIYQYLERGWPHLISLRLYFPETLVEITSDFWKWLPNLRYFGTTEVDRIKHMVPPSGHPIETLANLEPASSKISRIHAATFAMRFKNLKTVADTHNWEDIDSKTTVDHGPCDAYFQHTHSFPLCSLCILDIHRYCASRGWRYEDHSGRTKEEVLHWQPAPSTVSYPQNSFSPSISNQNSIIGDNKSLIAVTRQIVHYRFLMKWRYSAFGFTYNLILSLFIGIALW